MIDECPDCEGPIDSDGYTLDEWAGGCGWPHPDDCDTCGATYCDQSC